MTPQTVPEWGDIPAYAVSLQRAWERGASRLETRNGLAKSANWSRCRPDRLGELPPAAVAVACSRSESATSAAPVQLSELPRQGSRLGEDSVEDPVAAPQPEPGGGAGINLQHRQHRAIAEMVVTRDSGWVFSAMLMTMSALVDKIMSSEISVSFIHIEATRGWW